MLRARAVVNGLPTGTLPRPEPPFRTPAAEVYQATPAVTTPAQPPACSKYSVPPCEMLKKPITSRTSVISSVRKTPKTAVFTCMLPMSMYVLKTANANRNHASELFTSFLPVNADRKLVVWARSTYRPRPIQNAPYVENAVAPNTLRFLNSHIPAANWAMPP